MKFQRKAPPPRHFRHVMVAGTLLSAGMVWLAAEILQPVAPLLGLLVRW